MYNRDAHTFEAEGAARLGTSWDFERSCLTVYCRNLYLVAKGSLRETDGQFVEDIVALPLKELVRLDGENNIQVTKIGRASCRERV